MVIRKRDPSPTGQRPSPSNAKPDELAAVLAECARDTAESERRVAEQPRTPVRRAARWVLAIGLAIAVLRLLLRLAE
ncbi:MAG: hypothetical protein JRI23_14935 [Deltaproteobacteria bacterium]|nr:hypothetical protein [Deltaproteobacteria bacterium]MBW2533045.1 hypothetical protein [Deltaproteobacteria bacterium]